MEKYDDESSGDPMPPPSKMRPWLHIFPHYTLSDNQGPVKIDERPAFWKCIVFGLQHALAMLGGTVIVPMQLGFDVNTALFFSGISTLLFFIVTRGRVPAYLGCTGSAIGAILSVSGYQYEPGTFNNNVGAVQGALIVTGCVYVAVALIVFIFGYNWVEWIMPPVVTGAILTGIGFHLVVMSFQQVVASTFDSIMACVTVMTVLLISVYAPSPLLRRLCILLGTIVAYVIYLVCGFTGSGPRIDFSRVNEQPWVRAPVVHSPIIFDGAAISTIVPLVIVLLAENLGHLKALGGVTGTSLEKYLGNTYLGDALSLVLCGIVGSPPLTTYTENITVLSVTRVYSPLVIVCAAFVAVILGFISKFGAVMNTIPPGVFGGLLIVLCTLIVMTGIRIWIDNKVDFNDQRNVYVGGLPVAVAGALQTQFKINNFQLDGIGVATFMALLLYQIIFAGENIKKLLAKRRQLTASLPHHSIHRENTPPPSHSASQ
ncbi:permease family-domain-containing protein [Gongronella butleri]|nr:permease family-domain-containing protein [Gongronella butleri]